MATPTIKTKIALDGEKEYKNALSEINNSMKVLNSEMKLTSERFDDNAGSIESLAAKHDILSRKILEQKDKIEVLKNALASSAETYGESDARTKQWQTSLNNAETELIKMERELRNNEDAQKDLANSTENLDKEMKGLGDALNDLTSKFGINLPDGMKETLNGVAQVDSGMLAMAGTIAAVGAAAVEVTKQLVEMTTEAAASADNFLTLSQVTGISAQDLQAMEYASELVDVSLETLQGSLKKLIVNMGDAYDGSEAAQEKFAKLGISVTDVNGNMRDSMEVFYEIIDRLGGIENATQRDAIAMDLFGKSAQDLNPLIIQGTDALKGYMQEAYDTGYVLDDFALNKLGAVDDAYQRMQKAQEAARNDLAVQFAPMLEEFYNTASEGITKFGDDFSRSGLVELFGELLELVSSLVPILEVLGDVVKALTPIWSTLAVVLGAVADALKIISNLIGGTLNAAMGNWSAAGQNMSNIGDIFRGDSATLRAIQGFKFNAAGTPNFGGGLTWVGENGPELVGLPQGSRIYSAQESAQMSGGDTFYITIDANNVREFNDIVKMAQNQRRIARMGAN